MPPMAKVTPPNKSRDMIPVIDPRLHISCSKVQPLISMFIDALIDVVSSLEAPRRRHHPALVTPQPSKVIYFFPPAALYLTVNETHRPLKQHMLAVSSS